MTSEILKKLVEKSLKSLSGDWIIIGGTVLPLLNADYRTTVDIDMIPMNEDSNNSTLALMELASSLGLPIESINSAGLFFLKKIPNWQQRLQLHAQSKKCRIFIPNFDLYLELKISRLSESDFTDIQAYLKWHRDHDKAIDQDIALNILKDAIDTAKDSNRKTKLRDLKESLREFKT